MRTVHPDLLAHLNASRAFVMADLITLTLNDGSVTRYTNFDLDVNVSGVGVFLSRDVLFERGQVRWIVGIEVDTLDVTFRPRPASVLGGVAFKVACARGYIDGATLKLERAYLDETLFTVIGAPLHWFEGKVVEVPKIDGLEVSVVVKSELDKLNIQLPRNLYQPGCLHSVYDSGCTLNEASFAWGCTVVASSSTTVFRTDNAAPVDHFTLGELVFSSGVNNALRRTVKWFGGGHFVLFSPLPAIPAVGDTLIAYPGCDRQKSTCANKFNNLSHFRGMPYVPPPETVV